jgi:ABC-type amino acid transport system permease subunit
MFESAGVMSGERETYRATPKKLATIFWMYPLLFVILAMGRQSPALRATALICAAGFAVVATRITRTRIIVFATAVSVVNVFRTTRVPREVVTGLELAHPLPRVTHVSQTEWHDHLTAFRTPHGSA